MDDRGSAAMLAEPTAGTGMTPPVYDIDLYDDAVQGDLYPHLAAMRDLAPIVGATFARRVAGFELAGEPARWISGGPASWSSVPIEIKPK